MCSFFDPEHGLLKPFFNESLELSPQSRQSYFIRTNLCSNFELDVGLAPAINRKMVLINCVQGQKMNTFRHGTGCFKKFVPPYWALWWVTTYKTKNIAENLVILYFY